MSNLDVHYSSNSNEWSTPQDFFDRLDEEFHFGLDAAANAENAKCEKFYTIEDNSLVQSWYSPSWVFCNPPYGREQIKFVYITNATHSVLLIPARTDTKVWEYIFKNASEVRFITGRLKFGGCLNSAPFPSALVIFGLHRFGPPVITTMKARI